jgi:hypothetical protein
LQHAPFNNYNRYTLPYCLAVLMIDPERGGAGRAASVDRAGVALPPLSIEWYGTQLVFNGVAQRKSFLLEMFD